MTAPLFDARFLLAVALLAGFFAVRSWLDFRNHGARAYAWKEYTALLACALAGAVFAAALDSITSRLSPEYFTLGKGVAQDAHFTLRAVARGVQSGFAAGAVLGATLLFVSGKKRPGQGPAIRHIAGEIIPVITLATLFALGAAFLPAGLRPLTLDADTARTLGPVVTEAFDRVRTIHLGAYLGALCGTAVAVVRAIRPRRARHP